MAEPSSRSFLYTSCYCEENIYMLCKTLLESNVEAPDLFVVFISNSRKLTPIWSQKSSRQTEGFCLWDYHAICLQKCDEAMVWDLDTRLGLPVPFRRYLEEALRPELVKHSGYKRLFRVVSAPMFLKHFASDRRHMLRADGEWLAIPPQYECIVAEGGAVHNLDKYIDMEAEPSQSLAELSMKERGCVFDEDAFCGLFGSGSTVTAAGQLSSSLT